MITIPQAGLDLLHASGFGQSGFGFYSLELAIFVDGTGRAGGGISPDDVGQSRLVETQCLLRLDGGEIVTVKLTAHDPDPDPTSASARLHLVRLGD